MNCLCYVIGQLLEMVYVYYIQCLMVIGNFVLLVGFDFKELYYWYLGIYIDVFEWVELFNIFGMSQWVDGGIIVIKLYVSSVVYIGCMSDYCQGCVYDFKQKISVDVCFFNVLYWDFFLCY